MRTNDARPTTIVDLEKLAVELMAKGFQTRLVAPHGKRPYLVVRNPQASVLAESILSEAGWFWYSWAERIAPVQEVASAATKIAHVLRAIGTGNDT